MPYSVASLFFFSCWVRPDARYLVGFHLFCAALLVEGVLGTLDLLRRLAGSGNLALARFLGVSFAILQLGGTLLASRLGPPLGVATWICAGVGAIAAVAATSWPQRRIARFAAPALGLALFALAMKTDYGSMGRNAGVQEPEILRAKATVEAKVPPDAVIITTEDTPVHKPHPAPVLKALERLGATPEQAVYIGDSPFDLQSANAAGCAAIGVTWGVFKREVLAQEHPLAIVDTPAELLEVLAG